ncbi:MAG TPA: MerR family transcriptional regulator [Actinomycetes bacterium]|jgi:DNA-binding transcriptional MerR regulator
MSSALPASSLMSIGEVLTQLRPEFADVTISKIRFLESEGLVEPARTPSGYRKFSHADVARLRYVLAAQRDHYLPLRVIREHLDAIDRGLEPPSVPGDRPRVPRSADESLPGPRALATESVELRLSREELLSSAGIDAELLDEIEGYGLVAPVRGSRRTSGNRAGGGPLYDADALVVASAVAELATYGLEPRHLRAFRTAAERESDLVAQVVGPLLRQRSPQARARAEEAAREMGALSLRLHTALVRARLRDIVGT